MGGDNINHTQTLQHVPLALVAWVVQALFPKCLDIFSIFCSCKLSALSKRKTVLNPQN